MLSIIIDWDLSIINTIRKTFLETYSMSYSKRGNSILDEFPDPDRDAPEGGTALTVTLKPQYYELKPLVQYERTSAILKRLAKKYRSTFLYLVPELTPEGGNIHYHGTFKIENPNDKALFLREIGQRLGYKVTKYIDNEVRWNKYIHKDRLYEYDMGQYAIIEYMPNWGLKYPKLAIKEDKTYYIEYIRRLFIEV